MHVAITKPLFAWDCLEDSPSLKTLRDFLKSVPDARLLELLRQSRRNGRDDYPVHVLWGVMLLQVALRHPSMDACLAELRRNHSLWPLIGIEDERQVPKPWNMSRFQDVLGQSPHREEVEAIFNKMAGRVGVAVPDLGRHTAGDSTALNARRPLEKDKAESAAENGAGSAESGTVTEKPATAEKPAPENRPNVDEHGLPLPTGGRKEYTDAEGKVVRVVEWFGYKAHLLVDVKHEVTLSYRITSTKTADSDVLPDLVKQAQANLPPGRIQTVAYDKAADNEATHQFLDDQDIRPVIQNRSLWKNQTEQMLPGHDGNSNVVYDESGTLHCYDQVSNPPVRRRMSYIGHEPERKTLKYRCPAKHEGFACPMSEICNAGKTYGKTVRVKRDIDLRRFPPIPRATKQFERRYNGRTAVERVNARCKLFWGADDGNVRGATRFHALIGVVMIVHIGFATLLASAPRRKGTLGPTRLSAVADAIHKQQAG